jgi:hypothetical protein
MTSSFGITVHGERVIRAMVLSMRVDGDDIHISAAGDDPGDAYAVRLGAAEVTALGFESALTLRKFITFISHAMASRSKHWSATHVRGFLSCRLEAGGMDFAARLYANFLPSVGIALRLEPRRGVQTNT